MVPTAFYRWLSRVGLLVLVPLAGCSSMPGRGFTLFPEGNPLTESAKDLRQSWVDSPEVPRELAKRALGPYLVEPGDTLLAQPADLDSPVRLPGDQPVLPDGTIQLGRYGRLPAAGKTVEQIELEAQALVAARTKDAGQITVRLVSRQSKVFYVLGEVNAPGMFVLNGRETVLDGILTAGGLTERGSRRSIILSRPTPRESCRVVLPVCYNDIVQIGDTATNYQLLPGDRIFVPTRGVRDGFCWRKEQCGPCDKRQVPCSASEPACFRDMK